MNLDGILAMSGNFAIVGAFKYNSGITTIQGAAYIYHYNGTSWTEFQKLTGSDSFAGDSFGFSVDISGNTAVVSAYDDNDNGNYSGSIYIYRYNGSSWVETQKIIASDGLPADRFGYRVSVSGDRIVAGAPYDDGPMGSGSGSAYFFKYDGSSWLEEQKVVASDEWTADFFGLDCTISDDRAIIGAPGNDDAGSSSGAAYMFYFDGNTWSEEAKLTATDPATADVFGFDVDLSGTTAVIGALGDDDIAISAGSVYIYTYENGNWTEQYKINASDADNSDFFGDRVGISGDNIIVGAYGNDDAGNLTGSAYIFGKQQSFPDLQPCHYCLRFGIDQ